MTKTLWTRIGIVGSILGTALFLFFAAHTVKADPIQVLTPDIHPNPKQMMSDWYRQKTEEQFKAWEERYEKLQTPEKIAEYQKRLRDLFVERIGGFPERTPLNARITGVVPRDGYRVEKVLFESQPGHYVTAACFVPNSPNFQPPYPGVLIVCGHSNTGKAIEPYQSGAALAALNGLVALLVDPICQGERYEHVNPDGSIAMNSTTVGHTLLGTGAILLGQNTARNEIWDGMRGIDYLQERDDVDPERIGCMGNSGGGTQTAYLMSLDDRIKAASPACYITDFAHLLDKMGPQDAEQNIFGQLDWGMDHADYLIIRAPTPFLVSTASRDMFPIQGSWNSFRKAKRLYTRLGHSERIDLVEADGPHGWLQPLREASVEWMCRWLDNRNVDVREPKLQLLTDEEFRVTERGQVMLMDGFKSGFDLNIEEYQRLRNQQIAAPKSAEELSNAIRAVTGIRSSAETPTLPGKKTGESRDGEVQVEHWVFESEPGVLLPALLYRPQTITKGALLFVHPKGKQSEFTANGKTYSAKSAAEAGYLVLALDLRGIGETHPEKAVWYHARFGVDGRHASTAYLLGKSYVGMWGEEILRAARWLQQQERPEGQKQLTLVAEGRVGIAALHAAAAEPSLFDHVVIAHTIPSWETLIASRLHEDQFINVVHGAAREYDLPDLIKQLQGKIEFLEPTDALGKVLAQQ